MADETCVILGTVQESLPDPEGQITLSLTDVLRLVGQLPQPGDRVTMVVTVVRTVLSEPSDLPLTTDRNPEETQ